MCVTRSLTISFRTPGGYRRFWAMAVITLGFHLSGIENSFLTPTDMPDVVDRVSDGLGGDKFTVDEKADSEDGKREVLAAGQGMFSGIK